jgi:hypothetical protein
VPLNAGPPAELDLLDDNPFADDSLVHEPTEEDDDGAPARRRSTRRSGVPEQHIVGEYWTRTTATPQLWYRVSFGPPGSGNVFKMPADTAPPSLVDEWHHQQGLSQYSEPSPLDRASESTPCIPAASLRRRSLRGSAEDAARCRRRSGRPPSAEVRGAHQLISPLGPTPAPSALPLATLAHPTALDDSTPEILRGHAGLSVGAQFSAIEHLFSSQTVCRVNKYACIYTNLSWLTLPFSSLIG